jgi:hypothetical protein
MSAEPTALSLPDRFVPVNDKTLLHLRNVARLAATGRVTATEGAFLVDIIGTVMDELIIWRNVAVGICTPEGASALERRGR